MTAIKSQLKQAISDVSSKSAEVTAGEFGQTMAAQKASQAQSIIGIKESAVKAREKELDMTLEKLNPPPTKDISEGGKNGGTKTVVDQEEVKKLETQKTNLQAQVNQAKSEVADARQEAATASTEALDKAGVTKDKQSEMSALMDRINSAQDDLGEGKPVKDEDITKLITDFKTISQGLTKDQNKAGLISKAFYDPVKKGLDNILKSLDTPATNRPNPNAPIQTPAGTLNKALEDMGITGDKETKIVNFAVKVSDTNKAITAGGAQAPTQTQMQGLYDEYKAIIADPSLTATQLQSSTFTDLKTSVEGTVNRSGFGEAILPATTTTASS